MNQVKNPITIPSTKDAIFEKIFNLAMSHAYSTRSRKYFPEVDIIISMPDSGEKRGPIEKGEKGWPINPFGIVALLIFGVIIIFLIAKPLSKRTTIIQQDQQENSQGGAITSPTAGEIITTNNLEISLSVDDPGNVEKVQFWAKIYSENKWEMIGEADTAPYEFSWQIPANYEDKAIAITSHILQKDGNIIKDPGGWREGVIIISN